MTHATSQLLQRMSKPILQKKINVHPPITVVPSMLEGRFSNLWRNYLGNKVTDNDFLVEVTRLRHDLGEEHKSLTVIASDEFRRQKQLSPSAIAVLRAVHVSPMHSAVIDCVRLLVIGLVKAEEGNDTEQIVSLTDQVCGWIINILIYNFF